MKQKEGQMPVLAHFADYPEAHKPHIEVKWTLKEWHDVYVEQEDLTGYKAALLLVGDWKTFQRMLAISTKLSSHIDEWNEEIKIKIKSRAIENVVSMTQRKDSVGLSAAKWVSEEGWDKRSAGRPSKAQKRAEVKRMAKESQTTSEEIERVMEALQ